MFEITQGYPALCQSLCSHMVDIANQNARCGMNKGDLFLVIDQIPDAGTWLSPFLERVLCHE